jgi:hypothetical protein
MSTEQQPDQEPLEPGSGQSPIAAKGTSGRKSFSKLRRELSDEELASPAVQRMLLDEIERLDSALTDLRQFRERFHATDKQLGALQERFKSKISIEILHITCFAMGGAAIGYATSNWSSQPVGSLFLAFGAVLVVAGIIAKAVKP